MMLGHQGRGGGVCWYPVGGVGAGWRWLWLWLWLALGARLPKAAIATSTGIVSCGSMPIGSEGFESAITVGKLNNCTVEEVCGSAIEVARRDPEREEL